MQRFTVRQFAKHLLRQPVSIDIIIRVTLDARIKDCDQLDALRIHIGGQPCQVWITGFINCEDPKAAHIIDIEMNDIQRQIVLGETSRHCSDISLALVAPTRLVETQCPTRRQGGTTGQGGELRQSIWWAAWHEIIAQRASLKANRSAMHTIQPAVMAVFIKQQIATGCTQAIINRHGQIDRVFAAAIAATGVFVPKTISPPDQVKRSSAFAQSIEMCFFGQINNLHPTFSRLHRGLFFSHQLPIDKVTQAALLPNGDLQPTSDHQPAHLSLHQLRGGVQRIFLHSIGHRQCARLPS